ncbi:hypothetical protein HYN48_13225 [Flavobacterium magnum]|uniref:Permease n=1 Tax=Flavobacterium magnum TaxID=2162713 RepID=A0A2S0RIK8_9FLAO|nr:hypothetical protein [Flavobacterium magnum]AWA30961.1 hypothetical protein HYN48_13225 [Flavobacterium magnum]
MKIKLFWITIIKILGLLLFFEFLEILSQLITSLIYVFVPDIEQNIVWASSLVSIFIILFYLIIIYLLVFKSSWIVDKLKLVRDSEIEIINIGLKISSILVIAIIIVGGVIFINSFALLSKNLYDYFQQQKANNYSPTIGWIIFNSIKTLLGYLLMTNSKIVANYIGKQSQIE